MVVPIKFLQTREQRISLAVGVGVLWLLCSLYSFCTATYKHIPGATELASKSYPRDKILILSYYSEGNPELEEYYRLTWPNKVEYAARHGYSIAEANEFPAVRNVQDINPRYVKVLAILSALTSARAPEWIMWIDADAFFLNHTRTLEENLDDHYDLILPTAGKPPTDKYMINNGVYFIKNTPWSQYFYRTMWEWVVENKKSHECPRDRYGKLIDITKNHSGAWYVGSKKVPLCGGHAQWKDQALLMITLANPPSNMAWTEPSPDNLYCHVKYVAFRDFNSAPPRWLPGDLVVHIPGRYHDGRMLMMREFFRLADFETGTVRWEDSYFIKVDFEKQAHLSTPSVATPADLTLFQYEGRHGWDFNIPCPKI
ncbi:hypothetical protein SmJEL517_g04706 [Synchytrium microbalum]|uniref:Nucleotide-diphospho-sugar transferase domain-containing protein n=1 Tax=Synchytrium microbalum TaxID=1806994 RepID=A0A507BSU9_9FUNG|nr:uncharacterized protein SmJEL517_g04706 [Synchytrium microbalum]TPX32127.1 hypothetical protein SmJEL517_g04706 [Synchytrium microbalum]